MPGLPLNRFLVTLPLGRQYVRAVASETLVGPVHAVDVVTPKRWSTRGSAGRYQSRFSGSRTEVLAPPQYTPAEFQSLTFTIASGGRLLTSLSMIAVVPCSQTFTTEKSIRLKHHRVRVRIAPDGRFVSADVHNSFTVWGRVVGGKVMGRVRVATEECEGSARFVATRQS